MAYVIYGSKEGPGPYVWMPERNLMIPIGSGWPGGEAPNGADNAPKRPRSPRDNGKSSG